MELNEDQQAKLLDLLDHADDLLRVRFGPRPSQTLNRTHAEAFLTLLAKEAPSTFGATLRKVILNELAENGQR